MVLFPQVLLFEDVAALHKPTRCRPVPRHGECNASPAGEVRPEVTKAVAAISIKAAGEGEASAGKLGGFGPGGASFRPEVGLSVVGGSVAGQHCVWASALFSPCFTMASEHRLSLTTLPPN